MTPEELHQKINSKGIVEQWAAILEQNWKEKIIKYKIGQTRLTKRQSQWRRKFRKQQGLKGRSSPVQSMHLADSFRHTTTIDKVTFTFLMEGRFVDMGVGKGSPIGRRTRRKAKKWYSKELYRQLNKLTLILSQEYAGSAAEFIAANMPRVIELPL